MTELPEQVRRTRSEVDSTPPSASNGGAIAVTFRPAGKGIRAVSLVWVLLFCLFYIGAAIGCGDDEEGANGNGEAESQDEKDDDDDDDDDDGPGEPPEDPQELCEVACARIYDDEEDGGCDTLFTDEGGGAVLESTCVSWCLEDDKFRGGQWCVVTEAECADDPREMIEECFPDDYHPAPCSDLGLWEFEWMEREAEAVQLLNERRTEGAECGGEQYSAVGEVEMDELLRCGARLHSAEMSETGTLSATNEAGENTADRIENVGFEAGTTGGVVNHGDYPAVHIVGSWFGEDSDHCDTVMNAEFTHVGVGNVDGWWTLKLATKE